MNISNDHLDWHGTMKDYINSKFKIFEKQEKKHFSFVSKNLKLEFKKKLPGTLVSPNLNSYKKFKNKIENPISNQILMTKTCLIYLSCLNF